MARKCCVNVNPTFYRTAIQVQEDVANVDDLQCGKKKDDYMFGYQSVVLTQSIQDSDCKEMSITDMSTLHDPPIGQMELLKDSRIDTSVGTFGLLVT